MLPNNLELQPTKNIKSYIVSIDQEKALDKALDREFLYKIMEKRGHSKIFINFNKKIYKNTQSESVVANNGPPSTPPPLFRGLRKGWPLSPLLYIINDEAINLTIKANKKIVGYPIPNQKENLKLSQYADDTNLFVITEESIVEILNFFKTFEIATGATINISKTAMTPLANAKICNVDKKIQNIHINNPKNFVKILGIHFSNDLQKTITYNWELCQSLLEKQLQQLSRRHNSLRGKAILLNSLILSKVTFLSNIFPISNTVQTQIETNIFKYIWQFSKSEPTARKTLYLPKEVGGTGLIQPTHHSLAMRLKQFFKLKEQDNQESWILLTRYNLATILYRLHKGFRYMITNKYLKTKQPQITFYYNDILTYVKKHNKILNFKNNSKIIHKQII